MKCWVYLIKYEYKADSRFAPSQWATVLLCNDVSHWLGTNLESSLKFHKICTWYSCSLFCCGYIINSSWILVIGLPIFFRVASLALGQSYDCPSASEVTLRDMRKINPYQTITKQGIPCVYTLECTLFILNDSFPKRTQIILNKLFTHWSLGDLYEILDR